MTAIPNAQTEGQLRNFYQEGRVVGALPVNAYQFSGLNGAHFIIVNPQAAAHGRIIPIYAPVFSMPNEVMREGQTVGVPNAPSATVRFTRSDGGIPRQLYSLRSSRVTFYQSAGLCKDPSDFDRGWEDYLLVYANGIASAVPLGGQTGFEGDAMLIDSLDYTFDRIYAIGQLQLNRTVTATTRQMIAATYARTNSRNIRALGNEVCYVLSRDTTGDTPYLFTTLDGGLTWSNNNLAASPLGAWDGELVTDVEATGKYVIITSEEGYYLCPIDSTTGVADVDFATKVENGWEDDYYPSSVFALTTDSVLFASQDKRVYRAERVEGGVKLVYDGAIVGQDLLRVHGHKNTVVAVGTDGGIVVSQNKGVTWQDAPFANTAPGGTIRGVHVLSPYVWWICGDDDDVAYLMYTVDGGRIWTSATIDLPAGVTLIKGHDIRFVNDECGYFVAETEPEPDGPDLGNTIIFTTMNGGFTWTASANRLRDILPEAQATRIAVPEGVEATVAANSAVVVGNNATTGYIWTLQSPIK